MAIPVARVHLKVAHGALPPLLPTPPNWKMLQFLPPPPCPCVAAILPAKQLAKPGRADSDERWDAHKTKSPGTRSSALSSLRSAVSVKNSAFGRGSWRKNATSPPPKPGRADSAERWDAHKKAAIPSSAVSSSKLTISHASSAERWDVHKKRCPPAPQAELLDDGERSSTGSNDIDTEEEEEIVWKPRPMYAGPGFAAAAPVPSMLPMPTSFLVPVA